VILSRKRTKSQRQSRIRLPGTKAKIRAQRTSVTELRGQLEARDRALAEARTHLAEALEQQTATSEVLQIISRSPGELEAVFEAMLENATRICEAKFGNLWLREGDNFSTPLHTGHRPHTVTDCRTSPSSIPAPERAWPVWSKPSRHSKSLTSRRAKATSSNVTL
jgi:hypothetical protein